MVLWMESTLNFTVTPGVARTVSSEKIFW